MIKIGCDVVILPCSICMANLQLKVFSTSDSYAKGVIRIRKLKKKRQRNGQKKKYKKTNNDLQNIHIKLKIE